MNEEAQNHASELKGKLDLLNERKEEAFRRKQAISLKVADKLKEIGDCKKARNDLTRKVRESKVERDKLNSQISAKITEIKAAQPVAAPKPATPPPNLPIGPKGERLNPHELARQIKALEQKIETIPMSFEAEQKTMKAIKQLKKQLGVFEAIRGQHAETAAKSREIDVLKRSANVLHAQVTQAAKESQDHHEKLITLSKEVEDLKIEEETAYKEFMDAKQEYLSLSGNMKEVQNEMKAARTAERHDKEKQKKAKDDADQKTLKQRAKEAEEKMMKGEKLTTEDLLAMQSIKD